MTDRQVAARDHRIVAEFSGNNGRELARRYGVSLRTVQRVLARSRGRVVNPASKAR